MFTALWDGGHGPSSPSSSSSLHTPSHPVRCFTSFDARLARDRSYDISLERRLGRTDRWRALDTPRVPLDRHRDLIVATRGGHILFLSCLVSCVLYTSSPCYSSSFPRTITGSLKPTCNFASAFCWSLRGWPFCFWGFRPSLSVPLCVSLSLSPSPSPVLWPLLFLSPF